MLISNFWEDFSGCNISINFLISSVFFSQNLKVSALFLVLINLIFGWFRYFLMVLETVPSSDESKLSCSWFLDKFLIGILMKYSLNVFVVRWSWEITLSFSIKVILKVLIVLSVKKGLKVSQKVIFSVKKLTLDERNMDVMVTH